MSEGEKHFIEIVSRWDWLISNFPWGVGTFKETVHVFPQQEPETLFIPPPPEKKSLLGPSLFPKIKFQTLRNQHAVLWMSSSTGQYSELIVWDNCFTGDVKFFQCAVDASCNTNSLLLACHYTGTVKFSFVWSALSWDSHIRIHGQWFPSLCSSTVVLFSLVMAFSCTMCEEIQVWLFMAPPPS